MNDNDGDKLVFPPGDGIRSDGRNRNEQRFIDFPDNPDLYGNIDPLHNNGMIYDDTREERLRDFAPPGQIPRIGNPNSPNYGMDGQGGLLYRGGNNRSIQQPRGDYEQMVRMGLVPPPMNSRFGQPEGRGFCGPRFM